MKQIKTTPGFPFQAVLASHFLPADDRSPFWTDDFARFLELRQAALWERIKAVTGATVESDLEEEETALA